jgi:alanine dehydrogenase
LLIVVKSIPLVKHLEQASHNGDIGRAAVDGTLRREDVAELGRVLLDEEEGLRDGDEITVFDSTCLAVQDLAVAVAVYEDWRANRKRAEFVGVSEITL